jgi:hypothetical protein
VADGSDDGGRLTPPDDLGALGSRSQRAERAAAGIPEWVPYGSEPLAGAGSYYLWLEDGRWQHRLLVNPTRAAVALPRLLDAIEGYRTNRMGSPTPVDLQQATGLLIVRAGGGVGTGMLSRPPSALRTLAAFLDYAEADLRSRT